LQAQAILCIWTWNNSNAANKIQLSMSQTPQRLMSS
jgi:hypothetical protein